VATFNVNQFAPIAAQKADLGRLFAAPVDVACLQECTKLNLARLATAGWEVHQGGKPGTGPGNTAVLWRTTLGLEVVRSSIAPYIDSATDDLGVRVMPWVEFAGLGVVASAHRQPKRDDDEWDDSDAVLRKWAAPFERVIIGMDSNVHRHAALEEATGLSWRGVDIDGFLYRGHTLTKPTVLEQPASDHPCVVTTVS
jgi:hypothetical protein